MLTCKEDFKDRLTKAMEIRDLRAVDLAHKLGVTESTISQYKSGLVTPRANRVEQIASALGVDPVWLIGLDVPMVKRAKRDVSDFDCAILDAYHNADPVTQANICLLLGIKGEAELSLSEGA